MLVRPGYEGGLSSRLSGAPQAEVDSGGVVPIRIRHRSGTFEPNLSSGPEPSGFVRSEGRCEIARSEEWGSMGKSVMLLRK